MVIPQNYTILVVDDELDLRETLAVGFKDENYNVLEASNGLEAFQLLQNHKVDLVLSDIRMPKCDGMKLLELMKSIEPPKIPTIFMTGYSEISEEEAYKRGAASFINKPFMLQEIRDIVLNLLNKSLKAT